MAANIAEHLLKINAVRLSPAEPFTWASGLKSPIYCDNRKTLSFPEVRTAVKEAFSEAFRARFPQANAVAGVATAGIAHGALLADLLGLPFIYIRSKPKGHGLTNQIEGQMDPELNYVVIEDLVSTGGSSLKAVEALRAAGGQAAGLLCIFTYGFQKADDAFKAAGVPWASLTNLEELLQKAVEINYLQPSEMEILREWRKSPEQWSLKAVNS